MQVSDSTLKPNPFPLGILDKEAKLAFIALPGDGIQSIDLSNGKVTWRLQRSVYPLIAFRGILAVMAPEPTLPNTFRIEVFQPPVEVPVMTSQVVELPAWISVFPDHVDEFSFEVHAIGDVLFFSWQAHSRYRGGAPPPPDIQARAVRYDAGVARIDLSKGSVSFHPLEPAVQPRPTTVPEGANTLSYKQLHRFHSGPWRSGDRYYFYFSKSQRLGEERVALERVQDTRSGPVNTTELQIEPGTIPVVSADGGHTLIRQHSKMAEAVSIYNIFDVEALCEIGSFPESGEVLDFSVIGHSIYYVKRDSTLRGPSSGRDWCIRTRALSTSELLWEHPLPLFKSHPPELRL